MKTVQEAVEHYLPKKKSGEMSISDIRNELHEKSEFSEVEINSICANISDQELNALGEKKMWKLDFLDNIYFSIFMILASLAIFTYSFLKFKELRELADQGLDVEDINYFLPAFFMLASIIYLVRHVFRIVKRFKGKN